jgi:RND superfamily putative drug exporter
VVWNRFAAAVTTRRSWLLAVGIAALAAAVLALGGANSSRDQSPQSLPPNAESARADAVLAEFPGGHDAAAILVFTRADGSTLGGDDLAAATAAHHAATSAAGSGAGYPPVVSTDGRAAIAAVPIDAQLSGFALNDTIKATRAAAHAAVADGLQVQLTGGPAFGADIADAFTGANIPLLVITATVVALLLIITYRSPVLWLAPLLVVGFADQVAAAAGDAVSRLTGLAFDGATAGITSVLVFGAGTNYALLLISRYRDELRTNPDHRAALSRAVRAAGPAILASNATVVLALLTLPLAITPNTRSLGVCAACGLILAVAFVLLLLPPVLALCGPRLFWPFIPHPGSPSTADTGAWHRVAAAVGHRPALIGGVAIVALAALATGTLNTPLGLSQTEQFRVAAESVTGFHTLASHFPGGQSEPATVIAATNRAPAVQHAIDTTPGVVSERPLTQSDEGLSAWSVILDAPPASDSAFTTIEALRASVRAGDPHALVGGPDAQALDTRDAAAHDRLLVIPAILIVVLAVLCMLLRAAAAPPLLVAATVLSAAAALGLGGWVSVHAFGFPALDNSTPLLAVLFLVALGVDYTIFLVTRAREETPRHGTRDGMVRAVSATGAVITSAGIVLAAVFCVLGVLPLIVLTQLGIIVGLGILLDTFIVRTLVIPALFALIGPSIWWPTIPTAPSNPAGRHRAREPRPLTATGTIHQTPR